MCNNAIADKTKAEDAPLKKDFKNLHIIKHPLIADKLITLTVKSGHIVRDKIGCNSGDRITFFNEQ